MKYLFVFVLAVIVASVRSDVSAGTSVKSAEGHHSNYQSYQIDPQQQQQQQATGNEAYYPAATTYRNYQNQNPANPSVSSGYYNYYNPYYNGFNYNQPGNHQKQDFTDLFSNNNPTDLFGGGGDGGADAGEIGGTVTGVIAAIAAALGIKGVTKLGLYLLGFGVVFTILLAIPVILAIAAIAVAATQGVDKDNGMFNVMKQMLGKDDNRRRMASFNTFLNSEECVERISCAISQKTYGRFYAMKSSSKKEDSENAKQSSETGATFTRTTRSIPVMDKPSLISRISRGLKSENCKVYKCSVMSYFS